MWLLSGPSLALAVRNVLKGHKQWTVMQKSSQMCRTCFSPSPSVSINVRMPLLNTQKSVMPFRHCQFHTSSRRPVPPVFLFFLKPIAKLSAVLTGRGIRKWYQALGPVERKKVLSKLRRYWYIPAGLITALGASGTLYYTTHLEDTPITGRRRFIALTHEQIVKIAQAEAKMLKEKFDHQLYPMDSFQVARVFDIAQRLLRANPELTQMKFDKWNIYVIKDPTVNACVLPTGDMFVFDGILELANTQDQLAIILGHEMAHAVLEHGVEELSLANLVDVVVIFCLAALWCIIPSDGIAVITHWFYNKVIKRHHSKTSEESPIFSRVVVVAVAEVIIVVVLVVVVVEVGGGEVVLVVALVAEAAAVVVVLVVVVVIVVVLVVLKVVGVVVVVVVVVLVVVVALVAEAAAVVVVLVLIVVIVVVVAVV
ncbi:metalloendopeptidase OMA1, mitochondrial [Elysia marginata]|uniref:Metalloendopeptidase OMA1, mitochondrial n=1 Tax=Elysia marginata TaxID=1093978 RepID=A0AAV4JU06_9GAST|nr:metalloendopeptidase OMA1, mitochondrial [Elysia marginata]